MPVKIDESLNNSLPLTSELQLGNEKGEGKKLKKSNLQPLQDAEHIANSGLRVLRVDSTPTSFQHSILAKAVLPRTLKKQASLMALDPLKEQKESLTSVETLDDIISSNNVDDNCTGYVEMSTMSKRERRKYEKEKKKQEAQRLKCEEEKLHEEEIRREKERQRLMEEWKRDNQKDEVSDNADHVDDFFHAETSKSQVIDKHDEIPIRGSMNLFQNHIGFSAGFNPSSPAQVHMTKDTPSSFLDNGSRVAMPSREPISRKHLGFTGDSRNTQNTEAGQKFVHVSEKYLQEDRTVKERENTELMLQETNEANKKHQKEKKEDTTRKYQDVERKHEEDASSRHKAEEAEMKCKREAESQDKKNEENMELKRKEKEEAHRRCKEEVEQKEKELLRKNKELEQNKLQDLLKKSKVVELARLEEVRREQEAFKSKRREIAELQKKSEEESRRKEHEEKLKRAAEERKRLKERKKRADEERKRQIEDRTQLEEEKKRQLEEENRKLEKQRAEESRKCLAEEKLLEKEKKRLEEEKLLSDERELAEFGKRNEQKVKESLLEIVNKKSYLSDVLVPHLSDLKVRKTVIDEIVARFRVSNENTLMLVEEFIQDAKITLDPYLYTKGVNMEKFQRNFAAFVSSKIDTSNVPEEIDVKQFINSLGLDLNKYSFFDLSAESTAFPVHNDFSQQELMEEADRIRLLEEAIDDSEMLKRTSNCGICFVGQDGYKPMEHGPYQTNGLSGFAIKEELEEDVKLVITTSVDESEKYLDAVYEEISRLDKKLLKSIKRNRKISMLD
ncbi:hypothetical protein NADFUDRAFT_82948 [Nadsonia fulvescens var. elongata DSM 6958]|uniref:Uncharacterized protein n=1 Tax=Nadsonia fulvescens var. elongata DSM 6958 TaxID=857566 RepID=A0A1E3PKY7_9ASCO|nr:hypothetical protein NADFUDRAFT_82948 [Nadsonia fulvescens var. elongata DSM 6958]